MPPSARRKSSTNEKEAAAVRQKEIIAAKEKVLKIKRSILQIVEAMLEQPVPIDFFLRNSAKLCQADYDDIIQERSIEHMCGYPLCSNIIKKVLKQQYHISKATNKVYDLTERKHFCSNECYKASNFVKAQLSPIPLYMRKEEHIVIKLLSDCDNKGSAGEEIVLCQKISEKDIESVSSENLSSNTLSSILHEEIKQCADSLKDLKIKENVYENPYVFENAAEAQQSNASISDDDDSNIGSESDDNDHEDNYFPNYDNIKVLSQKHMPIPEKTKKTVLIPPLKSSITLNSKLENFSTDFVRHVFQDWVTEETLKYLLGERQVYSMKADFLFQRMMNSDHANLEKLSSVKNEYINLCLKLDKLQDDEVSDSAEVDIGDAISHSCKNKTGNKVVEPIVDAKAKSSSLKNSEKRKTRKKSKGKNKIVSFALGENQQKSTVKSKQEESPQETITKESLPDPAFPLIDSMSQDTLRRQVLVKQLKSVFSNVLPLAELHYRDVRNSVIKIVETFSLTPKNIIFKPKEWRLIAVVLFRILTKTVLKDLDEEAKFLKLCECIAIPSTVVDTIEELVCDIITPEHFLRSQSICAKNAL